MASDVDVRLNHAGAIGLLCSISTELRDSSGRDDYLDSIQRCVADWCDISGWTFKRTLHRIEVFPPTKRGG